MLSLAENIKRKREEKGLTLEQLAEHMGKSTQTIKKWEQGNVGHLTSLQLMQIAELLEVKPSVLMGWEEE